VEQSMIQDFVWWKIMLSDHIDKLQELCQSLVKKPANMHG